jgi:hypothetical protein
MKTKNIIFTKTEDKINKKIITKILAINMIVKNIILTNIIREASKMINTAKIK